MAEPNTPGPPGGQASGKAAASRRLAVWAGTAIVCVVLLALALDRGGPGSAEHVPTLLAEGRERLRAGDAAGAQVILERARRRAPKDARVWAALGSARAGAGDARGASIALRRALALDPRSFEANLASARLEAAAGNPATARALYERSARLRPTDPTPLREIAALELDAGRPDAALAAFDRVLSRSKADVPALIGRARALGAAKGAGKERAALEEASRKAPESARVWRALADARLAAGDVERSLAANRRVVEIEPNDATAWLGIGAALQRRGDCAGAVSAYERASGASGASEEDRALAWTGIGTCRLALGDHERALEALEEALGLEPEAPEALFAAAPLYLERGQPERAQDALSKASTRWGDRIDLQRLLARAALDAGDPRAAEHAASAVLEHDRSDDEAKRILALARVLLGDARGARLLLVPEGAPDPCSSSPSPQPLSPSGREAVRYEELVTLGLAHSGEGDTRGAVRCLERARASSPSRPEAWAYLVAVPLDRGDLAGAKAVLARADRASVAEHATMLEVRARALALSGDRAGAQRALERARGLARSSRERAYLESLARRIETIATASD